MRIIHTDKRFYKNKKRKKKPSKVQRYANELNEDLPASELWFQGLFKTTEFYKHYKHNEPLGPYIPDLLNTRLKIVIEVDGSVHDSPDQKLIDAKKDLYYISKGYKTFRVKAFSIESYNKFLDALKSFTEVISALRNKST